MLKKIQNRILPMLDTLGEAIGQYLALPSDGMLDDIALFIDAITAPLKDESSDIVSLSEKLMTSLLSPAHDTVEPVYVDFCETVVALPTQYKVVFLPYYDNTWDSLKSVYEAFTADPMFVTEIVIIPIKRNTPTGDKHVYNDYLTPQGIPNTHYDKYDFEIDKPDVVFYNQPYDGVNYPKFQSHNIKPHAGLMVYVPYYLFRRGPINTAEEQRFLDSHTQLPGHNNADIIVAQGQSFYKSYANRSKNGKKLVVLGNPKCDNIYRNMQDYPRYPEWDQATEGRTVFLLNTHYTTVTDGTYRRFMPYLLDVIEQNEDAALIWRPHPQSFLMFGEGEQKRQNDDFNGFLARVADHPRMILDRTASNVSAIMYCSAVMSQPSSVIGESIFADKPVFLLYGNPNEMLPDGISYEESVKRLARVRRSEIENKSLFSAVEYYGYDESMQRDVLADAYFEQLPLLNFITEIRGGTDSKKQKRGVFREQTFKNLDGTCGKSIHTYIENLINK